MEAAANSFKYLSTFPEASDAMHADIGFPGRRLMPFFQEIAHPEDEYVSRIQYGLFAHNIVTCSYFVFPPKKHTTELPPTKAECGDDLFRKASCVQWITVFERFSTAESIQKPLLSRKRSVQKTGRSLLSGEISLEELANRKLTDVKTPFPIPSTRGGVSFEVETEGAGTILNQHVWRLPSADKTQDEIAIVTESTSAEGGCGSEAVPETITSDAGISKMLDGSVSILNS
ncbi:hypothetical protein L486_02357 [Kwoniella mangroviensis CBS 10435]|uniref:Uncharacterized protein n=1 Tax=Kwoniella mangroviensis CBS 10435 TaxID=1331196 RepID=A0A1B9IVX9_9TREE|nr:hypothetical protein L486_02357 [Kwoniella mangroviensis CBS 10435]